MRGSVPVWIFTAFLLMASKVAADDGASTAPSEEALAAIELLESRDSYERQKGFMLLEALREPATVPTITPYMESHDTELRAFSIRALAAIQGVEAVPRLLEALHRDKNPRVRRAILLALEPLQGQHTEILPAFIKALRDRKTDVRMTAVDIVSRIDDPRAKDAIRERYRRERRRDVKRVLETAIKRVGAP